jgi:hypothetical protein
VVVGSGSHISKDCSRFRWLRKLDEEIAMGIAS